MRFLLITALVLAGLTGAEARNGFAAGGAADGAAEANRLDLQRRAIDLDARDGGSRYHRLRQQQEAEETNRLLRENNRLLEQQRMDNLINRR